MILSMKKKSLDSIDGLPGEFLSLIKDDRSKITCLEVFSKSINIVEWIRMETKGNCVTV